MPVRKIRVEFDDSAGNKYEIIFTGEASRQRAKYILELVELLGDSPRETKHETMDESKLGRLCSLLRESFFARWFSSNEVRAAYEERYGISLPLSTVCTYLARLTDRGMVMRRGPANSLEYKMISVTSVGETANLPGAPVATS